MDDQFIIWNTPSGVEIAAEDSLGLYDTTITGACNPGGSIPESDFLRFTPGSDAIDKGSVSRSTIVRIILILQLDRLPDCGGVMS